MEAMRLGVNEYLVKPVSARAIYDRLVSIFAIRARWCSSATITVRSRANTPSIPRTIRIWCRRCPK